MDHNEELIESWHNGNRSTVAAELAKMKPSEVLDFASAFAWSYEFDRPSKIAEILQSMSKATSRIEAE